MMRMRYTKTTGMGLELPTATAKGTAVVAGVEKGGSDNDWEMRPGGMLVQKRTDTGQTRVHTPATIRVRVKYGSVYHEVHISSQATFGELKKMLSGPTGLHYQDQKLMFKDKERDSNAFLDTSGVKDKSKLVCIEDPISQEKRYIEMKKNAKIEKAAKTISEISLEIDRSVRKVSAIETMISRGGKVVEKDLVNLIDSLMNQLLKLDGINADGDVKLQRKMQVRRIQKEVEKLDMLKIKNSSSNNNGNTTTAIHQPPQTEQQQQKQPQHRARFPYEEPPKPTPQQHIPRNSIGQTSPPSMQPQQLSRNSGSSSGSGSSLGSGAVVITTQWETFDSLPTSSTLPSGTSSTHPSFDWDSLLK